MTFIVTVVSAASGIKTSNGVANEVFEQIKGKANYLLTVVEPGTQMYNAAIFIDVNNESVHIEATTEDVTFYPYFGRGPLVAKPPI